MHHARQIPKPTIGHACTIQPSPMPCASDGRAGCLLAGAGAAAAIVLDCLFIKQNQGITHCLLWITPFLSPLSPLLRKCGDSRKPLFMRCPRCPRCPRTKKQERKQIKENPRALFPGQHARTN